MWTSSTLTLGLHDTRHVPETGLTNTSSGDYEKNLREIVQRLQTTGAKLIFAPIPPVVDGRTFGNIPERNAIALKVMKETNVAIDDLYTVMLPRLEELGCPRDVHFIPEGSRFLAEAVATSIEQVLTRFPSR